MERKLPNEIIRRIASKVLNPLGRQYQRVLSYDEFSTTVLFKGNK